ncbi:MAG: nucleotidyltransferase domain-containing protein [Planctomycetes bacterium]|nr:nucleotidyltransferase domain-containing protein [Planctomycetota bacterium]
MIRSDMLEGIVERIRAGMHPEKIIVFGSHADDTAVEDSDIDLLVVANTDLPPSERFPAASRLLADIPAAFDIIVKTPKEYQRWRSVVNHIVYLADRHGKVVYER